MSDTTNLTPIQVDEDELRTRLTPQQFEVTRRSGTEAAFTGIYWDEKQTGSYHCIVCGLPLFESNTKFESGTGWPSFWQPIAPERITLVEDRSHGMIRVEANCVRCGSHLGHVFNDGPAPTGERFCMNSASLQLISDEQKTIS